MPLVLFLDAIDPFLGAIPDELGMLTSLTRLVLSHNQLKGKKSCGRRRLEVQVGGGGVPVSRRAIKRARVRSKFLTSSAMRRPAPQSNSGFMSSTKIKVTRQYKDCTINTYSGILTNSAFVYLKS